jgi:hypothetical protein
MDFFVLRGVGHLILLVFLLLELLPAHQQKARPQVLAAGLGIEAANAAERLISWLDFSLLVV